MVTKLKDVLVSGSAFCDITKGSTAGPVRFKRAACEPVSLRQTFRVEEGDSAVFRGLLRESADLKHIFLNALLPFCDITKGTVSQRALSERQKRSKTDFSKLIGSDRDAYHCSDSQIACFSPTSPINEQRNSALF